MEYVKSVLTGSEPNESFKKMCVNCKWHNAENGSCVNPDNESAAIEKIRQALTGYEIEEIKLKPVPLKDDTKKCQHHELDSKVVLEYVVSMMQ